MLLFWPCAWGLTLAYDFKGNLNNYFYFLIYQHLSPLAEFPAIIYIFYQWLTGMH